MSVFEAPTTGTEEQGQGKNELETNDSFVAKVIATKGANWDDPETVAKGYIHAQQRIAELESQAEEFSKQDYAKELLAKLQEQTNQSTNTIPEGQPKQVSAEDEGKTTPSPDDLKSLIEEALTENEAAKSTKENVATVDAQLMERFGTEAKAKVVDRANSLGMSLTRLQEIAGESPSAFMALMGEASPKETNQSPRPGKNSLSQMNTDTSGERNSAYYRDLRRKDAGLYRRESTQAQMMQDKIRLGDKF